MSVSVSVIVCVGLNVGVIQETCISNSVVVGIDVSVVVTVSVCGSLTISVY